MTKELGARWENKNSEPLARTYFFSALSAVEEGLSGRSLPIFLAGSTTTSFIERAARAEDDGTYSVQQHIQSLGLLLTVFEESATLFINF